MIAFATSHLRWLTRSLSVPTLVGLGMLFSAGVNAQTPPQQGETPANLDTLSPTVSDQTSLTMAGAKRLMSEAEAAVSSQNYPVAAKKLQEARQAYNQLSNFYQTLTSSFLGIDNKVSDSQRKLALDAAQMRDNATYQLALVHRVQNQPGQAIPLLVEIISSQKPTRDLGQKAYQQLLEIGFVDTPYTRPSPSSKPPAPPPPQQEVPQQEAPQQEVPQQEAPQQEAPPQLVPPDQPVQPSP